MFRLARSRLIGRRALLLAGVLAGVLALSASLAPVSQAALDGCRSDPVIYLSDGSALDVNADIGTNVSNVTTIAYTLHVPAGLKAVLFVATPNLGFHGKETFSLLNDAPAGQYSTDTFIQTRQNGVSVTAHTTLVGVYLASRPLSLQSKPASGFNGQHLWTTVYR